MPIYIEFVDGVPVVRLWADINDEDPTHEIEMRGAAETLRTDR